MYAAVMSFGSGSSLDWTSITKAELIAENSPAWLCSGISAGRVYLDRIAYKNESCVEILVILLGTVSVKFGGFLAIDREEVSTGVVGSQWFEELLEGRM